MSARKVGSAAVAADLLDDIQSPELDANLLESIEIPLSSRGELNFYFPVRDAVRRIDEILIHEAEKSPNADLLVNIIRRQ